MSSHRIIIYGNSVAGKTTLARQLQQQYELPRLDLDSIAWGPDWGKRRPLQESITELLRFIGTNEEWIIEGCYGDLIDAALPYCTDLRLVNPGIDVCVANCRKRHSDWQKHRRPEDERPRSTSCFLGCSTTSAATTSSRWPVIARFSTASTAPRRSIKNCRRGNRRYRQAGDRQRILAFCHDVSPNDQPSRACFSGVVGAGGTAPVPGGRLRRAQTLTVLEPDESRGHQYKNSFPQCRHHCPAPAGPRD